MELIVAGGSASQDLVQAVFAPLAPNDRFAFAADAADEAAAALALKQALSAAGPHDDLRVMVAGRSRASLTAASRLLDEDPSRGAICYFFEPTHALAIAASKGADLTEAMDVWLDEAEAALALIRRHRRRTVVIELDSRRLDADAIRAAVAERFGGGETAPASSATPPPTLDISAAHRFLAASVVANSPKINQALAELRANTTVSAPQAEGPGLRDVIAAHEIVAALESQHAGLAARARELESELALARSRASEAEARAAEIERRGEANAALAVSRIAAIKDDAERTTADLIAKLGRMAQQTDAMQQEIADARAAAEEFKRQAEAAEQARLAGPSATAVAAPSHARPSGLGVLAQRVRTKLGRLANETKRLSAIRESPLFDAAWYSARNPDVGASGLEPATHYLRYGWREGRAPSAAFDAQRYLAENPDVAARKINPLLHFELHGRAEGRRHHALGKA